MHQPIQLPLLRNADWRKYPEVEVRIGPMLPKHITIKHIYIAVKTFGEVDMIFLDVDTRGLRQGTAKVRFSKVYVPFWEDMRLDLGSGPIPVRLEKPRGGLSVQSRVNPSKLYPSKLVDTSFSDFHWWMKNS